MSSQEAPAAASIALGIDLGAVTTRIALLDSAKPMPTIVRNELSNEATSTAVCYPANEARCYGENAASKAVTKPAETVVDLAQWLYSITSTSGSMGGEEPVANSESEGLCMLRKVGNQERHPVQMAAYFIRSLLRLVPVDPLTYPVCLAIPTAASAAAAVALRQACALAGVPKANTIIAPSDEAMAVYFHHMQYARLDEETPTLVTLIDVGQMCVSACIVSVTRRIIKKFAVQSLQLGSGLIDGALCSYVYGEVAKKFGAEALQGDAKSLRRILRECRKAKEILSTVEETRIQLEALQGHIDITIPLSRALLAELAAPFVNALRGLLTAIKASLPTPETDGNDDEKQKEPRVEVIGGGWRSPFVADVIREVLGVERLGVSLDANLAVAEGCAILAQVCSPITAAAASFTVAPAEEKEDRKEEEEKDSTVHEAHRVTLLDFTIAMPSSPISVPLSASEESAIEAWARVESGQAAADTLIHARQAAVNELDTYVLQTLQTADECEASAEKKEQLRSFLLEHDDYVQDDCNGDDVEAIAARLAAVKAAVAEQYSEVAAHRAKLEAASAKKEAELEKLSKEQKEVDSDLKSDPQRLRAAQKRREQGAALFKQEHWQEAQTRFVQALAILGQLYDVSQEDTRKTRDEIALSCHLNIASCSVKLGLWRNAVNNSSSALELAPQHPKALFRRGQALAASKEYKEAVQDLEQAAALSSNDTAVMAELAAATKSLLAQKAKEKKMFAKMFS